MVDAIDAAHLIMEDAIATGGDSGDGSTNTWPVQLYWTDLPITNALAILATNSAVELAEPNDALTNTGLPDDPYYLNGSLWGMYGSDTAPTSTFGSSAATAWQAGFTGLPDICVGVIDTGIQIDHPDLAPNIWTNRGEIAGNGIDDDRNHCVDDVHGWNFLNRSPQVYDDAWDSHGTHVAGTIGAVGNNGQGVAGINWAVTMIPVKILGRRGIGSTKDAVKAVDYLTQLKQRGLNLVAINASWGGYSFSRTLHEAIIRAAKADILFAAAAGNESCVGRGNSHCEA